MSPPYVEQYSLPDLLSICTFPWANNPHYARCRAESSTWIEGFNFFIDPRKRNHFRESEAERLCAYAYPYADYEALRTCCDFVNLLLVLDEISDEQTGDAAKATGDVFIDVLNGKQVKKSELSRMSTEFRERLFKSCGESARKHFIDTCTEYLQCVAEEARLREQHTILGPESFMAIRRENSAVRPCFALINIVMGVEVPDNVFENPIYTRMYHAAIDMICWSNDLYSYDMEQAMSHFGNNVLSVLRKEHSIDLQEAADKVGLHFERLLRQYQQDKALLAKTNPDLMEQVKGMVYGMECWVIGNLYWSFHSGRYFGDRRQKIMETRVVELTPRRIEKSLPERPSLEMTVPESAVLVV